MERFRFSPPLVLATAVALVAIAAVAASGWLALGGLTSQSERRGDVEVLGAAVAIARHSSDLMAVGSVPSNATMDRDSVVAARAEIARLKSTLAEQVALLEGGGAGAARVAGHVDSLVQAVEEIDGGRPDLLRALLRGEQAFQELVVTNTRVLFPAITTSIDDQLYFMLTGQSDARPAPVPAARALSAGELQRFWHMTAIQRDVGLGHTMLSIASLVQEPTRVARTQESFDTVAQRLARSLEYLAEDGGPELDPRVVPLAGGLRDAGSGKGGLFEDLEARLELAVRERELIAASEAHHAALLAELDGLAGDVRAGAAGSGAEEPASDRQIMLLAIAALGAVVTLLAGAYAARRAA